jgi:hypothetical protein
MLALGTPRTFSTPSYLLSEACATTQALCLYTRARAGDILPV